MQSKFESIIFHIAVGLLIASIIMGLGETLLGWQL